MVNYHSNPGDITGPCPSWLGGDTLFGSKQEAVK